MLGSDLYFCGGEFPPTNSFFRYNSIYNEWREMPNLKNSRTELSELEKIFLIDGNIKFLI